DTHLPARQVRRLDRAAKLLLLAAREAWQQSGWKPSTDLPLVLGTTSGGMSLGQDYYRQAIHLSDALGFGGPIILIANACASGANAIGHAWELIRNGRAQRAMTGG